MQIIPFSAPLSYKCISKLRGRSYPPALLKEDRNVHGLDSQRCDIDQILSSCVPCAKHVGFGMPWHGLLTNFWLIFHDRPCA